MPATWGRWWRRPLASGAPVIVVDDGSTDGSGEAAAAAGATVVRHARNQGKGAAILDRAGGGRGAAHRRAFRGDRGRRRAAPSGRRPPAARGLVAGAVPRRPSAALVLGARSGHGPGRGAVVEPHGARASPASGCGPRAGRASADSQSGFRVYPDRRDPGAAHPRPPLRVRGRGAGAGAAGRYPDPRGAGVGRLRSARRPRVAFSAVARLRAQLGHLHPAHRSAVLAAWPRGRKGSGDGA